MKGWKEVANLLSRNKLNQQFCRNYFHDNLDFLGELKSETLEDAKYPAIILNMASKSRCSIEIAKR
jgi:hypothetical protein